MTGHLNGNSVSISAVKARRLTKEQEEICQKTMETPQISEWKIGTGKAGFANSTDAPIADTARFAKGLAYALCSVLLAGVLLWCMLHAREIVLWMGL